ncbi:MAG TPA: CPBP family glutamic-type intramembrane protease [Terriglobales bacterium]|nr:CPBP family glutamic-type intramembrane protease [Terriglobales bacterium]
MNHMFRDLLEVAVAYALIEAALWTPRPQQFWWSVAAMVWVLASTIVGRKRFRTLGLGSRGFRDTLWMVPGALAGAGIMLLAAWLEGTLHPLFGSRPALVHALLYLPWALAQQFLLQSFFFLRLERAFDSGRRGVLAAALLYSLAHIPNESMVLGTLLFGLISCDVFRHARNVYPLALAHFILGLAFAVSVPASVHHNMRVGLGYLRYPN